MQKDAKRRLSAHVGAIRREYRIANIAFREVVDLKNIDNIVVCRAELGIYLRGRRVAAGLTVRETGALCRVAPQTVSSWELGYRVPTWTHCELLSLALGRDANDRQLIFAGLRKRLQAYHLARAARDRAAREAREAERAELDRAERAAEALP